MPLSPPLKGEEIYSRGLTDWNKKTSEPNLEGFNQNKAGKIGPGPLVQRVAYARSLTRSISPTASFSNLSL